MPELVRCAEDPLGASDRMWLKAEDPFQFLATCFEVAAAARLPASEREAFVSRLPCHVDGSCNGLQHYAALGRDRQGGASVNLVNGAKPGDVYTEVSQVGPVLYPSSGPNGPFRQP